MSNFSLIVLIIYLSTLAVFFSLVSKKLRRIIYGSLISTILPFSFSIMNSIQFGFNGMVVIVDKLYYINSLFFDRLQLIFEDEKELLFFFANIHSEISNALYYTITGFVINIKLVIFNLSCIIKNTIINVKNIVLYNTNQAVRRINISKQQIYFRV